VSGAARLSGQPRVGRQPEPNKAVRLVASVDLPGYLCRGRNKAHCEVQGQVPAAAARRPRARTVWKSQGQIVSFMPSDSSPV
jgi:hypothetical protein